MKTYNEIIDYITAAGKSKTERNERALIIQGVLAGMFIAMGAIAYFRLVAYTADPGIGKFLGALIFPAGIMAILLVGAELFTSDCMGIMSVFRNRVKFASFMRMLTIVLLSNLAGAVIMALLSTGAGIFSEAMIEAVTGSAVAKTAMPITQMLISAILCNIIVCSGVMMAYSAKTVAGKLIAVWFPIAVFVLSGTEHIVANMFYLVMGYINGAEITIASILVSFVVVTIGNFIGGALIVTGAHYFIEKDMHAAEKKISDQGRAA